MGQLVWLASYPKSGNTWLRAFLHNFLRRNTAPQDIDALTELCAGENGAELYRPYDPRPAEHYSIADVQRLRPRVHRDLTRAFPGPVFVKTHNAALMVEGVPLVTPEVTGGAIYLVRDPRDVAISYSRHLGLSLDATIAFMADDEAATGGTAVKVYEKHASWSIHVQSWTWAAAPSLLILRYEDLLADPVTGFGKVIRFMGLSATAERLNRAIEFSGFPTLRDQEQAHGFTERPAQAKTFFNTGTAGHWRGIISPAQAARIERDHGRQMARFGYR